MLNWTCLSSLSSLVIMIYYLLSTTSLVCMRDRCGKMAADSELTKQLSHMTSLFTQKPLQNSNKFK